MVSKVKENDEVRLNSNTLVREKPGVYKAKDEGMTTREVRITLDAIIVCKAFEQNTKDVHGKPLHYKGEVKLIFNPETLRVKEVRTPKTSYSAFLEEKKFIHIIDKVTDDGGGWSVNFLLNLDEQSKVLKGLLAQKPMKDDFERIMHFKPKLHW